ncbi:DUF4230 domain-containing protein [Membranicola marinus]|uniref:DUF4230 domain-containing protein n=1 Tax=Membranihabitans marinus TaxID=1227546 RepID=A0A953HKQ1_9BACT|nr:DUF4230 domain-containing protein [Membranihabitans marinus]MBY5956839.1 DUF4230 domain-containing protein [Membranihabitans marinus]
MKNIKNVLLILLSILLIAVVIGGFNWVRSFENQKVFQQSDIILNQIKSVQKLITVEGYFTELYTHKDYYKFDISPLRKKALVRVKAKASVGVDLSELRPYTNPQAKTLHIQKFPKPEILSLDHSLDYYDISEGTFNYFSTTDYNDINKKAKQFIEEKIMNGEMIVQARKQSQNILETITSLVESMGWELVVDPMP